MPPVRRTLGQVCGGGRLPFRGEAAGQPLLALVADQQSDQPGKEADGFELPLAADGAVAESRERVLEVFDGVGAERRTCEGSVEHPRMSQIDRAGLPGEREQT